MKEKNLHIDAEKIKNLAFEDLLFGNKNKDFGAYELRKIKNKSALYGFLISAVIVTLGFSWPFVLKFFEKKDYTPVKVREKRVLKYSELSAPPPIELEKPPAEKIQVQSREIKKFIKPVVKPDEEVIEPYLQVEVMPTFPGGEQELLKYLAENVKYPRLAREAKIQGLVIVRFVVDADGFVGNIELLRGIGAGCDEEALRVVNSMPKWEPGYQNNRAVPVIYNMPIRFALLNK